MIKALKYILSLAMFCVVGAAAVFAIHTLFKLVPDRLTYAETTTSDNLEYSPTDPVSNSSAPSYDVIDPSFEPLIEAYKVIVDGKIIGIITNKTAVDDIICSIQDEYEKNANVENTICEIYKEIVVEKMQTYANNITDKGLIEKAIADCVAFKLNAYELSIDGFVVGYFATKEECNEILNAAKDKFIKQSFAGKKVLSISFDKEFSITRTSVLKEQLDAVNSNDAVDIIISDRNVEKKATASNKEQLKLIYDTKSVSATCVYEDMLQLLAAGQSVSVVYNERIVNFNVTVQTTKTSSIAYTTTYRANTSLKYNVSQTVKAGKNGTKTYTYSDTYINGEFVSSKLTSEKITAQPVGAIIEYGTKLPVWTSVKALTGKGIFKWPSSGFITSHFVNGGHTGIDIANVAGTPIYAAADGTVKTVKNLTTGYGKYVVIAHSNGYETYYAHMSKYIVKEGQQVKQGQIIGYVGMTGEATGNHCHFGITKNGKFIDPTTMLYGYAS